MKKIAFVPLLLLTLLLMMPFTTCAEQQPEMITEKMAFKFSRGVANTIFGVVEFPKQMVLTGNEIGPLGGLVIGPLKGIGMTAYRTFIGLTETIFFAVPQPGYYDPLIDPAYVWDGWEPKHETSAIVQENAN
jgi:putative exosortase-associated protein (TIGR04073 family)